MTDQANAYKAFIKAQAEMKNADLNAINPHFKSKYADLPAVIEAVKRPLNDNGLCYIQDLCFEGERYGCMTKIVHESGVIVAQSFNPIDAGQKPQQLGSAITYARRYTLSAACGIAADQDDDGNQAQASNSKPKPPAPPATPEQIDQFNGLMKDTSTQFPALMAHLKINAENAAQMDDTQIKAAINALSIKKKKMGA